MLAANSSSSAFQMQSRVGSLLLCPPWTPALLALLQSSWFWLCSWSPQSHRQTNMMQGEEAAWQAKSHQFSFHVAHTCSRTEQEVLASVTNLTFICYKHTCSRWLALWSTINDLNSSQVQVSNCLIHLLPISVARYLAWSWYKAWRWMCSSVHKQFYIKTYTGCNSS